MSSNAKSVISNIINSDNLNETAKKTLIDSFIFLTSDINENSEKDISESIITLSEDVRYLNSYIKSKNLN